LAILLLTLTSELSVMQPVINEAGITATPNGSQTDSSHESFVLKGVIPALIRHGCVACVGIYLRTLCRRLSPTKPVLVMVDGHLSHVSAYLARRFAAFNIFVVILPSHMSTVLQPADNGLQALIKKLYRVE
jgi:hypothetical protein